MNQRRVDPLERQASLLLYLLGSGGPRTRDDIRAKVPGYPPDLASMRRQFERDKQALLDREIPLRVAEHGDEWRYEIRAGEYYLPDLRLTAEERLALELALSAVRIGGAAPDAALRKVGADVDPDTAPVAAALPHETALPALFAARRTLSPVTFGYAGDTRTIDPYAVFFTNGYWYVAGRDHHRDAQRAFRVDRIESAIEAGPAASFVVPADFRAQTVLPEPWELPGDEPVLAEVWIDAAHGPAVAQRLGDKAQVVADDDGSLVVSFEVRNRGAFRSWLFGMLDHAVVLGPADLRADIVGWLKAMAAA